MKKIDVLIIGGGMTFKSHTDYINYLHSRTVSLGARRHWTGRYLSEALGESYEVTIPRMPLQDNAQYLDWKIHFEKYLALVSENFILIGISLGGTFLAKYLSENVLKLKALSVLLVCPPYDDTLNHEDLVGGFTLSEDLHLLQDNTRNLRLFFSEDDDVVPADHARKYAQKLPLANIDIYKSKNGHFQIEEFPEIITYIRSDS